MLRLLLWLFLHVRWLRLEQLDSNESYELNKEKYDELGSVSGSLGTCVTCSGGLLSGIEFSVGVIFSEDDEPFGSGGGGG